MSFNQNFHLSLSRQGRGMSTLRGFFHYFLCHYVLRVGRSHREMTNVIPFAVYFFLSLPLQEKSIFFSSVSFYLGVEIAVSLSSLLVEISQNFAIFWQVFVKRLEDWCWLSLIIFYNLLLFLSLRHFTLKYSIKSQKLHRSFMNNFKS